MSSQRLPQQINPFKLARQGQELQGVIDMNGMERLAEMLNNVDGDVNVGLRFGVDEQGVCFAKGRLTATVQLTCQRCMKPTTNPIDATVSLAFVSSDEQARNLPEGVEPYIVTGETVALADVAEDELILALPIVAVHEEHGCEPMIEKLQAEAGQTGQTEEKPNPFAVLSDLKLDK